VLKAVDSILYRKHRAESADFAIALQSADRPAPPCPALQLSLWPREYECAIDAPQPQQRRNVWVYSRSVSDVDPYFDDQVTGRSFQLSHVRRTQLIIAL
jgi:hypothetical protein